MAKEARYRHELKYQISYPQYIQMCARLKVIMQSDPNVGADGTYRIRSIYFDNMDDKALREKVDGVSQREKFRIRYYNDDISQITLEKKIKHHNLCMKCDAPITAQECQKLLEGDWNWMKNHDQSLVQELYAKMTYQRLKPKVGVSYVREPYIYRWGNVRVTFDSEIRTTLYHAISLTQPIHDISATDLPTDRILEVKFDDFLPEVIQHIIQSQDLRQQAFSKYGTCRRFG